MYLNKQYLKLLSLANVFYARYYSDILFDPTNNLDYHHGKIRELIGNSGKDLLFLEEELKENLTQEDFSIFKSIIYGTGIHKFNYNEDSMLNFNHSKCKTLFDVINSYLIINDKKDESFNIWIHFIKDLQNKPYIINDILSTSFFILEKIIFEKYDQLINFDLKDKNLNQQSELILEYHNEIFAFLEKDFTDYCYNLVLEEGQKIKNHYSKENFIFIEDDTTITVPSLETSRNISIDFFFEDLEKIKKENIQLLYDFILENKKRIEIDIEEKFEKLYFKHKTTIDIRKNIKRQNNLLNFKIILK